MYLMRRGHSRLLARGVERWDELHVLEGFEMILFLVRAIVFAIVSYFYVHINPELTLTQDIISTILRWIELHILDVFQLFENRLARFIYCLAMLPFFILLCRFCVALILLIFQSNWHIIAKNLHIIAHAIQIFNKLPALLSLFHF